MANRVFTTLFKEPPERKDSSGFCQEEEVLKRDGMEWMEVPGL